MKKALFIVGVTVAVFASGCNDVGNAPAGMSDGDAKAAIAAMKPEDRIRAINSSPMSATQKQAAYAEIEKETGVKRPMFWAETRTPPLAQASRSSRIMGA